MNSAPAAEHEIESYLTRLRTSLRGLPAEQVEDIVREIRSHLIESAGTDRVGLWVQRVPPDDWSFQLGRVATAPADAREVLGWYIVPLGLLVGAIALTATSRYLLSKVRKFRSARSASVVGVRDDW